MLLWKCDDLSIPWGPKILLKSIYLTLFLRQIQDGHQSGGKRILAKTGRSPQGTQNFDEITLSHTICKINVFL